MKTEYSAKPLEFHELDRRRIMSDFNDSKISSNSGGVLLREVERRTQLLKRLAGCFLDHRDPDRIEHGAESPIKQLFLIASYTQNRM